MVYSLAKDLGWSRRPHGTPVRCSVDLHSGALCLFVSLDYNLRLCVIQSYIPDRLLLRSDVATRNSILQTES